MPNEKPKMRTARGAEELQREVGLNNKDKWLLAVAILPNLATFPLPTCP